MRRIASSLLILGSALMACGDDEQEVPDTIEPESVYFARCESPRPGADFPDVEGSLLDEQLWLRSWTDNTYLWYQEVPRADPRQFTSAVGYFNILKTGAFTPSGKAKDRFHFTFDTAEWEALSQSGVEAGYGFVFVLLSSAPPRKGAIAYVEPNSPAAAAGLDRGASIVTIDGVDLQAGSNVDALNAGLFPAGPGETHKFVILDLGATTPREVTLTSASVTSVPVRNLPVISTPTGKVGYIVFNDHIATAEKGWFDAVSALSTAGISDLVLDMRYNGGGYLAIASEVAYMIAGPTRTAGKTFEVTQFNDKHTTTDPVTEQPLQPTPFISKSLGFTDDLVEDLPLPTLGLSRVFVLTGPTTCSASEAVINGLAGIDVEVIQIGTTTCGKPYGFYPADNCGTTYFSIQFQGVNHKGFGDYADGFVPGGVFKGCTVADDFTHALGDPAEARLAAALTYQATGACPPAPAVARSKSSDIDLSAADGVAPKPIWRQNRIMTRPATR
jgi:carboxyl-terminal processing protease